MKFSIVTPVFNSARYLPDCIRSVQAQRAPGIDIEHIVMDGGSTDGSQDIVRSFGADIAHFVSEPDRGAANAINKGFRHATGDVVAWLNADDGYYPGALVRVAELLAARPAAALCFGRCPIVDEDGREIRRGITRFKEFFFPLNARFTIQCLNYISQPAMFFRRRALEAAGPLREDWVCAWDYDLILRLWRQGGGIHLPGAPLAFFRWHERSLSGQHFRAQFREEWQACVADAGLVSLQALLHYGVRWGIVWSYSLMQALRRQRATT